MGVVVYVRKWHQCDAPKWNQRLVDQAIPMHLHALFSRIPFFNIHCWCVGFLAGLLYPSEGSSCVEEGHEFLFFFGGSSSENSKISDIHHIFSNVSIF